MQIWTLVLRLIESEWWQLARTARLEKHVALQLWTRYSVSSLEVVVMWKRRLL